MRQQDKIKKSFEQKILSYDYEFCHYKRFDYSKLKYIYYFYSAGRGKNETYNDVIIMADTETSKKRPDEPYYDKDGTIKYKTDANHVCAWTISIRAFHHNIVTLWGKKPSKMAECMLKIHMTMSGMNTIFYFHNLSYDHYFLRQFWYKLYGLPIKQLNTKPHYPIYIAFENGIIIKDSLILAQKKLEKWANDLNVAHKKAVGKWDYNKIRNQSDELSEDEKQYIECDTLAGVECIDATMVALNKKIYSMPYTATGIPREETRHRGKKKAHDQLLKMSLSFEQYLKQNACYHGGYTHGNRHYVNQKITPDIFGSNVEAYDFASSYPYIMCSFKFPMEKYTPTDDCDVEFILSQKDEYAFMFKFIAINIRLKTDMQPMPALQFSKCVKTINAIQDNGRILCANYVEIYLTEWDLAVIEEQYTWSKHICKEVEYASKEYLPRWFTDYVYECFTDKTMLKGGDKVAYAIAKAKVNSLYGMCCQKSLRDDIAEDYSTGDYYVQPIEDPEAKYYEYINKVSSILNYAWGVTVTAAAFYNVHQLIKCCRIPMYTDTDSCYGIDWDPKKLKAYNDGCKENLLANGYGAVVKDDREYWLGVAEHNGKEDEYSEFKFMGAKRYCGRCLEDNEIHITVAGVPKKKGATCLEDDINKFSPGFIFSGLKTGKNTHVYIPAENGIYIDSNGNETADSISLIPCDYKLDSIYTVDWEKIFTEEVVIQVYDEDDEN